MTIWDAPSDRDYLGQGEEAPVPEEEQEPPVCEICEEAVSEVTVYGILCCADCANTHRGLAARMAFHRTTGN